MRGRKHGTLSTIKPRSPLTVVPAGAPALTRHFGDGRALLLVKDLQDSSTQRLLMPLSGVYDAIAIALQRFRFDFSLAGPGRNGAATASGPTSSSTIPRRLQLEPDPRRRKEIARRRRQPAEAARRFFFQIVQIIFAPTPGDATIDFEPDRFRQHVARWQHVLGHPEIDRLPCRRSSPKPASEGGCKGPVQKPAHGRTAARRRGLPLL